MDAGEALDGLTQLSKEIERAAIVDSSGAVVAVTPGADGERLARTAAELLEIAARTRPEKSVRRVVVDLESGTLLVVRSARHTAVATTAPEPPVALVVHDLEECLGRIRGLPKLRRKANSVDA